jgi:hypothetical protein
MVKDSEGDVTHLKLKSQNSTGDLIAKILQRNFKIIDNTTDRVPVPPK